MADTFTLDGLNINDGTNYEILDGVKFGDPELKTKTQDRLSQHGAEIIEGSDYYDTVTHIVPIMVKGSTRAIMHANISALQQKVLKRNVVLEYKLSGSTLSNYADVLYGQCADGFSWSNWQFIARTTNEIRIIIEMICQPFWRGTKKSIPPNLLLNGRLNQDGNSDGVANNWTSGTDAGLGTSEFTNNGDFQRISITGTGATATGAKEIYQVITTGWSVGDIISISIEFKSNLTPTNANYDAYIYFVSEGSLQWMIQNRTSSCSPYQRFTLENITIPAGATGISFGARVQTTAIGGSGELEIRKAMVVKSATIPSLFYDSLTDGIGEIPFEIEGDIDTELQVIINTTNNSASQKKYQYYLGCEHNKDKDVFGNMIYIGAYNVNADSVSSTGAIYGSYIRCQSTEVQITTNWVTLVHNNGFYPDYSFKQSKYRLLVRTRTNATNLSSIELRSVNNAYYGIVDNINIYGDAVNPYSSTKWKWIDLGLIEIPPFEQSEASSTVYSQYIRIQAKSASTIFKVIDIDEMILLPINQGGIFSNITDVYDINQTYSHFDGIKNKIYKTGNFTGTYGVGVWPGTTQANSIGNFLTASPSTNTLIVALAFSTDSFKNAKLQINYYPKYLNPIASTVVST